MNTSYSVMGLYASWRKLICWGKDHQISYVLRSLDDMILKNHLFKKSYRFSICEVATPYYSPKDHRLILLSWQNIVH